MFFFCVCALRGERVVERVRAAVGVLSVVLDDLAGETGGVTLQGLDGSIPL